MAKTRQKIITLQQTWSEKEQELQEEKLQLNKHLATLKAKSEIEETEKYSHQQTEDPVSYTHLTLPTILLV